MLIPKTVTCAFSEGAGKNVELPDWLKVKEQIPAEPVRKIEAGLIVHILGDLVVETTGNLESLETVKVNEPSLAFTCFGVTKVIF